MKIEGFQGKSTERLKGELKAIQIVAGALTIVSILLLTLSIYGIFTKENNSTFIAILVVAFSCGAIIPLQFVMISKIKKELNLRESST